MNKRRTQEFLQLTNTIPYPPAHKAKLSIVHSKLIDQVLKNFDGTRKMKTHIIHVFNCISYMYISSDTLPDTWCEDDPLHTYVDNPDDLLEERLADCFIHQKDIEWVDVNITTNQDTSTDVAEHTSASPTSTRQIPKSDPISIPDAPLSDPTPKSDLYIQPPTVPQFDTATPIASANIDGTIFAVYKSYPEIPTKQNEIAVTTDVNMMTDNDLLKLFPNRFIRTRAESMYEACDGITLDSKLGLIIPIEGYDEIQIRDNIIKYPHIFKLCKEVDGKIESFYNTIEIDGELHKTSEIWSRLPESKAMPYTKEFVKEYVVRRYLLERDIKGVQHRYKLYGTLDPFLTLFTSLNDYRLMGYTDPIELARQCVIARVNYKTSRNPVLRRISNV